MLHPSNADFFQKNFLDIFIFFYIIFNIFQLLKTFFTIQSFFITIFTRALDLHLSLVLNKSIFSEAQSDLEEKNTIRLCAYLSIPHACPHFTVSR